MTPPAAAAKTQPADAEVVTGELVPIDQANPTSRALSVMADRDILANVTADNDWADVDDGDLDPESKGRIPHIILNRKLDGGFTDPDSGELTQELDFIWLAKSRSRGYWPVPFGKGGNKAPDCRSNDGIKPDEQSLTPMSETCATCPLSQWTGDDAPPCKASIEALVFVPDLHGAGRVARLRFGGIAVKPANDYWNLFATRVPRKPPIAFITHAELVKEQTDNGTFLTPKFSIASEIARDNAQGLIAERNRMLQAWKDDTSDDLATGNIAGDADTSTGAGAAAGGTATYDADEQPF